MDKMILMNEELHNRDGVVDTRILTDWNSENEKRPRNTRKNVVSGCEHGMAVLKTHCSSQFNFRDDT